MQNVASFIIQCRTNWFLGIRPGDQHARSTDGYKALIKIAQAYFDKGQYEEFAEYFMEGKYLIPLWTAHLIVEYGRPTADLKARCLEVIAAHTNNPLAPEVAMEEKTWLDNHISHSS